MLKKYISVVLLMVTCLRASECPQLAPYCQDECLSEEELETKACSKTYNNLVVANALRTSNLNVTSASTLTGASIVNGTLNVNGTLFVNGLEIGAGLPAFGSFTNIDPVLAEETNTNVLWSTDAGMTTLANPYNDGFIITATGTGIITIQNPGIYLYNFGVVLQGNGADVNQVATAQLMLNGSAVTPIGVTSFTIPASAEPDYNPAPFELTNSGLIKTTSANATLALSMNFTPSWTMPTPAGGGANAYITIIQVN
jgi:hypothetical protein